ncbi:MAG TPA: DUF4430 domain-containing protein [Thermoleophilaceae bacterium]|nr:DUF4430 domain-containing protein [Thermoleophilaceae bacterium]
MCWSRWTATAFCLLVAGSTGVACGGDEGAPTGPTVTQHVTRDFGREVVSTDDRLPIDDGETVLELLRRDHDVETTEAGRGVVGIDGERPETSPDGVESTWVLNVNGIEADTAPRDYPLHPDDVVQWDLRDWDILLDVRATVGAFPETFTRGSFGKRFPTTVECASPTSEACRRVKTALERAGIAIDGSRPRGGAPPRGAVQRARVLVGPWRHWRERSWPARIDRGTRYSGVFARFTRGGDRMRLLDPDTRTAETVGAGSGLIAAMRPTEADLLWMVTGVDDEGVERAASALDDRALHGAFAAAVTDAGIQKLPLASEPKAEDETRSGAAAAYTATTAQARTTVTELARAFARGNLRALCARISESAKRQAGLMAHGKVESCPRDLRQAFAIVDPDSTLRFAGRRSIGKVSAAGGRATVTLEVAGRPHVDVALVESDGRWLLDSFFGTPQELAERSAAAVREAAFPSGPGRPARVADAGGVACFPFFADQFPEIDGGCELQVSGRRVAVTVATPFGDFDFGDCEFGYTALADDRGRTWITDVSFTSRVNNGCADLRECRAGGEEAPWRGAIRAVGDDRLVHRIDACLDTCVGFYTGELIVRLTRRRGRWTAAVARSAGGTVGLSGFGLDGRLDVESDRLRIRAATPSG